MRPRNQRPDNAVRGVIGAAVRHITWEEGRGEGGGGVAMSQQDSWTFHETEFCTTDIESKNILVQSEHVYYAMLRWPLIIMAISME